MGQALTWTATIALAVTGVIYRIAGAHSGDTIANYTSYALLGAAVVLTLLVTREKREEEA